jgi:hypothetical protein
MVDTRGHILAMAGFDDIAVMPPAGMKGLGWVEMAHPEDVPGIVAWFADGLTRAPNVHRGMWRHEGRIQMARVAIVKTWCGGAWMVVAEFSALRGVPARAWPRAWPVLRCRVLPDVDCQRCPECPAA